MFRREKDYVSLRAGQLLQDSKVEDCSVSLSTVEFTKGTV